MAASPDVLAAVDLGTNSIHLVVAKVEGSRFEVIEREREMVRLGSPDRESADSGDDEMRRLDPAAMDRAVAALGRFRELASVSTDTIRVVATSAVREADNRAEFLARVREEVGVEVEVISGFEEARLIHLGVLQAVPVFDRRLLVCDIGGGSTEVVVGQRGDVIASRSFKLGAIRLTQRFFPYGEVTKRRSRACRDFIRGTIAAFVRDVRRMGWEVAAGSSGTIEAVFEMAAARRDQHRPRTYNNFTISRDEVGAVVGKLLAARTAEERAHVPGLDARRADIIVAGALILEQVMASMDIPEITFSDFALREGVLLDTWRRTHGGSLHHLSDLRRRSVEHLAELMDEDPAHSAQVARLALQLFDGTADLHGLGDDSREVLEAAALLSNVGLFVSHSGHHKHTYYVIRNSEHLAGFTDREIELIAQVARYHRKSEPTKRHPPFAALDADDQRRVEVLAGLLRVAVGLDRNHSARVADLRCHVEDGELRVEVVPRNGDELGLELFSASQRTGLLESALGRPVELVRTEAPDPAVSGR
ncbi:MAG TPA: Ppx/GppA phosphatase family protein [Acidimicrobiales bacterium]|nr:Ppx/GppA phosphatase family protein [Acidimicrobiales bacterium]